MQITENKTGFIVELVLGIDTIRDWELGFLESIGERTISPGFKIQAIKNMRKSYNGMGLRTAKELVEWLIANPRMSEKEQRRRVLLQQLATAKEMQERTRGVALKCAHTVLRIHRELDAIR